MTVPQEEIFRTKNTVLSQCDKQGSFFINYCDELLEFKLCDLITLRDKIQSIDVEEMLGNDAPDIELIYLSNRNRFLILNVLQVIEFRHLLSEGFNILALNSTIHKILRVANF